jgi:hypothetical protein
MRSAACLAVFALLGCTDVNQTVGPLTPNLRHYPVSISDFANAQQDGQAQCDVASPDAGDPGCSLTSGVWQCVGSPADGGFSSIDCQDPDAGLEYICEPLAGGEEVCIWRDGTCWTTISASGTSSITCPYDGGVGSSCTTSFDCSDHQFCGPEGQCISECRNDRDCQGCPASVCPRRGLQCNALGKCIGQYVPGPG